MVQLFGKVLCPIDFSEHSLAALDVALKVVKQNDAKLYLLNVAPVPPARRASSQCRWILIHSSTKTDWTIL